MNCLCKNTQIIRSTKEFQYEKKRVKVYNIPIEVCIDCDQRKFIMKHTLLIEFYAKTFHIGTSEIDFQDIESKYGHLSVDDLVLKVSKNEE